MALVKVIDLKVLATTDQARAALDYIAARADAIAKLDPTVKVRVDRTAMTQGLAVLAAETRAAAKAMAINVPVNTGGLVAATGAVRNLTAAGRTLGGVLGRPISLFGGALGAGGLFGAIKAWHLLFMGVGEVVAVLGSAAIAAGAFAIAAGPAVRDITARMKILHTTAQALNTSIPPITGKFQALADAVKPQVFALFGDALTIINGRTGVFSRLVTSAGVVVDQLAARMTLAITNGKGFGGFLNNAAASLAKVGDIIGNLAGALGYLFKALPGYGQILFSLIDVVSRFIETLARVAEPALAFGLKFHGALVYAGLAVTGFARLMPAVLRGVSNVFGTLAIGAGKMRIFGSAAKTAENGLRGIAVGAEKAAFLGAATWGWIGLGVIAIGGLIWALSRIKDSTQNWIDGLQANILAQQTFQGVSVATSSAISQVNKRLADTPKLIYAGYHGLKTANNAYIELTQATGQFSIELAREHFRLGELTKAFGSSSQALGIMNALHLKASDIVKMTRQQWAQEILTMKSYTQTVAVMAGETGGRGVAAIRAMDFALNAQLTSMQQVTQAEDAFINRMVSGQTAFTGFEQGMHTLAVDSGKAGASLSGLSGNSLTLANDFYSTVIPAAQALISKLQLQFIKTKDLTTVVADEARQMLPFTKGNAAARDVIIGLINNALGPGTVSLKNLNTWIRHNSGSMTGFKSIVDKATVATSQLSKSIESQLVAAFQQDLFKLSGADRATRLYTQDILNNQTTTAKGRGDRAALIKDLENAGLSADQARRFVDGLRRSIGGLKDKKVHIGMSGDGSFKINQVTALHARQGGTNPNASPAVPRAAGGLLTGPGGPTTDSIPVWASSGEYVVKAAAVNKYGAKMFDRLNAMQMASGGLVGATTSPADLGAFTTSMYGKFQSTMTDAMVTAMRSALAAAEAAARAAAAGFGTATGGGNAIVKYAERFLGAPYVWGGTTPSGWDCSGFTSFVYHHFGIPAPRTSQEQQMWARPSGNVPGALVFFYGTGGTATHVGISLGNQNMINAANPAVGTLISNLSGNSGFGVPPHGTQSGVTKFDQGGYLPRGMSLALNNTGSAEVVTPARKLDDLIDAVDHVGGLVSQLIGVTAAGPAALGDALNGGARSATYRAMYGTR